MSRNMLLFELKGKITFNNTHSNCVIFCLELTPYSYNTRSRFHNKKVLIVYKLTIRNKCSKSLHLNHCTAGLVWSRTFAPFEMSRGDCEWLDNIKNASVKCLFIFNCSWMGVPIDKNIKTEVRRTWGLYLKNCLRTHGDMNCCLVLVWRTNSLSLYKHFRYIYSRTTCTDDYKAAIKKFTNYF